MGTFDFSWMMVSVGRQYLFPGLYRKGPNMIELAHKFSSLISADSFDESASLLFDSGFEFDEMV